MFTNRAFLSIVLGLAGASAVACGGSADPSAMVGEQNAVGASEPTPAAEELPSNDTAENTPVTPTGEELGDSRANGTEGQDDGLDAALAANPAAPETPADSTDGELGQTSDALLSDRGTSLASEGKRIAGFTDRPTSYYSFTTYMNESTGTRRTDCSGLMTYILKRKQATAYSLIPIPSGASHPVASDFYDYFMSRPTTANTGTSPRWRRIVKPQYLVPGDLVVYKYSSTSSTGTTGHVMMVTGSPTAGRSGELLVKVVDSARSGHANDTRGTTYSGPGTGTIGIKYDSNGYAVGYYWSGGKSTTLNTTKLAFGRLE